MKLVVTFFSLMFIVLTAPSSSFASEQCQVNVREDGFQDQASRQLLVGLLDSKGYEVIFRPDREFFEVAMPESNALWIEGRLGMSQVKGRGQLNFALILYKNVGASCYDYNSGDCQVLFETGGAIKASQPSPAEVSSRIEILRAGLRACQN